MPRSFVSDTFAYLGAHVRETFQDKILGLGVLAVCLYVAGTAGLWDRGPLLTTSAFAVGILAAFQALREILLKLVDAISRRR